jgi:hypothetical protein
MAIIDDGTGSNRSVRVTSENRLSVDSVIFRAEENAIRRGEGWQIASAVPGVGHIQFDGAAGAGGVTTAMLYFDNQDPLDMILDRLVVVLGSAAGATGDWFLQPVRNPSLVGATISNPAGVSNSNHGNSKAFPGTALRSLSPVDGGGVAGTDFDTITGGTGAVLPIQTQSNRTVLPLGRRLPQGQSFGVRLTAPPGITGTVAALVVAHVYLDFDTGAAG